MALTATVHTFDITLNDADRGVYETLSLRAARHPSETAEFLMTRVLAYCLEFTEGLQFSKGLSDPDVPALFARDLTGALTAWIEVGLPDAARLHKATKNAGRVAVYCHREASALLAKLEGEALHRAERIEICAFEPGFLGALAARLERRMSFDLAVTERHLYLTLGTETLAGAVHSHRLAAA